MKSRLIFLAVCFVLGVEADRSSRFSIDQRIVGGFETTIELVPYQVSLLYFGFHRCGGSILSCKYVLTAAHCTEDVLVTSLSVRAGSTSLLGGGTVHDIIEIHMHPQYDPDLLDYDASILSLRNLIRYDASRQPIKLPFLNEVIPVGTVVVTSGWGSTQNFNESNVNLRQVQLKVTRQAQCNVAHLRDGGVTTRMVCATAEGKDSCDGDSGGPLQNVRTKKLIGIVSFGASGGCAQPNVPGVYTRVPAIRRWIRSIVGF